VGERVARATESERKLSLIPWRLRPMVFSARHFPRSTRALVTRTGWKRPISR